MRIASLYVYYRVRPDALDRAQALSRTLLDRIAQRLRVRGRLLRRCDEPALWMEIYESVADPAGLQATLEEECTRLDFVAVLLPGEVRHCECFVEMQPCA
jgi:hypothetical protein